MRLDEVVKAQQVLCRYCQLRPVVQGVEWGSRFIEAHFVHLYFVPLQHDRTLESLKSVSVWSGLPNVGSINFYLPRYPSRICLLKSHSLQNDRVGPCILPRCEIYIANIISGRHLYLNPQARGSLMLPYIISRYETTPSLNHSITTTQ